MAGRKESAGRVLAKFNKDNGLSLPFKERQKSPSEFLAAQRGKSVIDLTDKRFVNALEDILIRAVALFIRKISQELFDIFFPVDNFETSLGGLFEEVVSGF